MPATFTKITTADLDAWVASAKHAPIELDLPGVSERVLFWPLRTRPHLGVAVFTSVTSRGGRGCGQDAIRVAVYDRERDKVLSGSRRIHRTQGWRERLAERVREGHFRAKAWAHECPRCKVPLALRKGRYGEFYGCTNYPTCRYTKEVSGAAPTARLAAAKIATEYLGKDGSGYLQHGETP